jgi:hypothetical protein
MKIPAMEQRLERTQPYPGFGASIERKNGTGRLAPGLSHHAFLTQTLERPA